MFYQNFQFKMLLLKIYRPFSILNIKSAIPRGAQLFEFVIVTEEIMLKEKHALKEGKAVTKKGIPTGIAKKHAELLPTPMRNIQH